MRVFPSCTIQVSCLCSVLSKCSHSPTLVSIQYICCFTLLILLPSSPSFPLPSPLPFLPSSLPSFLPPLFSPFLPPLLSLFLPSYLLSSPLSLPLPLTLPSLPASPPPPSLPPLPPPSSLYYRWGVEANEYQECSHSESCHAPYTLQTPHTVGHTLHLRQTMT